MRLQTAARIIAALSLASIPLTAGGQARVVIQVFRSLGGGTIPFPGAFVCFTANNNTQAANGSGQVIFENIPVGSGSAVAWSSGFKQKRVDITIPPGATVVPAVVTLNERSTDAPFCIVPRLGEEKFPIRGKAPLTSPPHENTLDCHQFSQSHVMVGIIGKHGQGIDEIKVVCRRLQPGGTLGSSISTDKWDQQDDAGTSFNRQCPEGQVVSAMQVSVHPESGQVRSATIQCKTIGSNGLTSGAVSTRDPIGTVSSRVLNFDTCNGGRPARAIRAGSDAFSPMFPMMFAPYIIATTQLICEQPLVP